MMAFVMSRVGSALVTVFGVIVLVFSLVHLVPGDPVEVMLGESAQPADRQALRTALGLDDPLPVQFGNYLRRLAVLDMGTSLHTRRPVSAMIAERFPATAELAVTALIVALLIALPLVLRFA